MRLLLLLLVLAAPVPASAHPAGQPPLAQIVPAGTAVRTTLTLALDDTIILLHRAGAAVTDLGGLGPDALVTQPGVEQYVTGRYRLAIAEGPCTAAITGGRDAGASFRIVLDHTCPAPVGDRIDVHAELLRDVSPDYRLRLVASAANRAADATLGPGETDVTLVLRRRAAAAPTSPEEPAPARGLASLFAFLDRGRGPAAAVAALVIAAGLGAVHGLGPGHGKTLVAAYLAGSPARMRDAFGVGLALAVTHTAAVIAFGVVALTAGARLVPRRAEPVLALVASVIVVSLGVWLLVKRIGALRRPAHEHAHVVKGRGLLAIGFAGGIVPCPEAFGLLFVALSIGRVAAGLLLLLAFSAGLAAVLVAVAVALVATRGMLSARIERAPAVRYLPVLSAAIVTAIGTVLAVGAVRTL